MTAHPVELPVELSEDDELDGGDVLPGLRISLNEMFAQIEGV
jgi:hypothetical protein